MVYSSSFIFAQERTGDGFAFIKKQALFVILGFGLMVAALQVPIHLISKYAYHIAFGSLLLLILVLIPGVGSKVLGAQRWIRLGPLSFQPGEIAKFAMIIFAAKQLDKKRQDLSRIVPAVVAPYLIPLVAVGLLLLQPDFGTSVIILGTIFLLLLLADVPKKFLLLILALGTIAGGLVIAAAPYRVARLTTFLDPWKDPLGKGFQILQSLLGLHNGGFWGVGLGNGKEKLFYLPEAHNDFIFAVIGEELGFLGVVGLVLIYLFFIYKGLKIAHEVRVKKSNLFASLLAAGITLCLGVQAFVNMGVVMGLLPTKGLTLPFVSYGGSAIVIDLAVIGVLLKISTLISPSQAVEPLQ